MRIGKHYAVRRIFDHEPLSGIGWEFLEGEEFGTEQAAIERCRELRGEHVSPIGPVQFQAELFQKGLWE
jgi:hypothetical protein